jgi:hypothetical protein
MVLAVVGCALFVSGRLGYMYMYMPWRIDVSWKVHVSIGESLLLYYYLNYPACAHVQQG